MPPNTQDLAPPLWKLAPICSIASFFVLLPSDAIPTIIPLFHIRPSAAEGLISWAMFGYGLGPLLYGPIANRFGRIHSLYMGFSLACIGTLLSYIALSYDLFSAILWGRLLTGIGSSSGLVISMIMIKETYAPPQARHMLSLIVMFFALAQSVAMVCGGWLSHYLGIGSIFIFMLATLLILLIIIASMKETYQGNPIPINILATCMSYIKLFKNPTFILLIIIAIAGCAVNYIFNGISPLYAVHKLSLSPDIYGQWVMLPSIGLIAGSLLSAHLSEKCNLSQLLWIGVLVVACGAFIMLINFLYGQPNLLWLLLPGVILFLGTAILLPNASMAAIGIAADPATASSVVASFVVLFSSFLLYLGGYLYPLSDLTFPLLLLALPCIGILCLKMTNLQ